MEHRLENLFPLIFDSINEGVFTVNESFHITSFNAAAERITGVDRNAAVGQKCYDVFRASICQNGCALRETLANATPKQDIRVDILNQEMKSVPISVSTAVLKDSDGKRVGGVEIFRDISEMESLRDQLAGRHRFMDIIGESNVMQELFRLIPKVAKSDSAVLINGQSGTGKELVAAAIHDLSPRSDHPFVRVNCGALPDTLLESELFGYKRGAFTGANTDKPGRFQQANGGTLFLDEIGDISPAFQVKLLRALEEGEVQPLGDTRTTKVNVRLLSATNQNLEEMVEAGTFREDLYYRIRVIPITLAPLRERRKDIPLLVTHFIEKLALRFDQKAPAVSKRAMAALFDYDYPGNVRELSNIIERAFVLLNGHQIDIPHLPKEVLKERPHRPTGWARPSERRIATAEIPPHLPPQEYHLPPEADQLKRILSQFGWNRERTAKSLGIGRTTLWRRMKEYGLI